MTPKPADEWMNFALDDLESGEWLFCGNRFTTACFHAQQAAEKALKGFLVEHNVSYPQTHNLYALNKLCRNIDNTFGGLETKLALLTQFYVPARYPDAAVGMTPKGMPDKDIAREALDYAREIFDLCSEKMRTFRETGDA